MSEVSISLSFLVLGYTAIFTEIEVWIIPVLVKSLSQGRALPTVLNGCFQCAPLAHAYDFIPVSRFLSKVPLRLSIGFQNTFLLTFGAFRNESAMFVEHFSVEIQHQMKWRSGRSNSGWIIYLSVKLKP